MTREMDIIAIIQAAISIFTQKKSLDGIRNTIVKSIVENSVEPLMYF